MPDDELARRMFQARHYKEGQAGKKVVLREISAEVSQLLNREKAYDPSVVARWLKAEQEPDSREQWVALAQALSVDVGWLAFGAASKAPAPFATTATSETTTAPPLRSLGERERLPEPAAPPTLRSQKRAAGGRKRR